MKKIIDIENWNRRDNFRFFQNFINPCISITSEVECSFARQNARDTNRSFFIYYLYAILRAVNEIDELRYRIDSQKRIFLYESVDVLSPIKVGKDGKFSTVRIPWKADFEEFYQTAYEIIRNVSKDEDPYAYTRDAKKEEDDKYNVILVSATPDLYFTSITHTQELPTGSDYPLLNVGKAIIRENKLVMPVAIYVHHGFVDGKHLSDFYKKVEMYL